MGGGATTWAPLIIAVVWASLTAVMSSQLQHQPQWRQKYEGPLAAGPHLRSGQQSLTKSHSTVGRQLVDTHFSSLGQKGRQFGQQRHDNQRIIPGRQQELGNQGLLSGGNQLGLQPYNNLNLVHIPKDILPDVVPLIPIIPVSPTASSNSLQQTVPFRGQNSGQPGGYNSALSSGQNSGSNRLTNQFAQQSSTRPLQPSQTSLQSAQRTPPSRLKSSTSNRKVQSSTRPLQPSQPSLQSAQRTPPSSFRSPTSNRKVQSSTRPLQPRQPSLQSAQRTSPSSFRSPTSNRKVQSSTRPLQPRQPSLQSSQRTSPSSFRSPTSNRKVEPSTRRPQPSFGGRPDIAIIEDIRDGPHSDGSYYFKYGQTDGTVREEGGQPRGPCELRVTGNYFYQAPNGENIHREYVADGLGHREFPAGTRPDIYNPPERVPVAPPMPAGGMPPCDDGQYRPMGDDGQYRPMGNDGQYRPTGNGGGQWRPQGINGKRPRPPQPQQPQQFTPPTRPQPQPQSYIPQPRPQPQQPQQFTPPTRPQPQPQSYIPQPQPQPQQPQQFTPPTRPQPQPQSYIPKPRPQPQQPQQFTPPTRPQPQPQSYVPQPRPQPQPQILNPAPQPFNPTPQYGGGGSSIPNNSNNQRPSTGAGYNPSSSGNITPGTGLNSGQNPGLYQSIRNINTQNNNNSRPDGLNVLNYNSQNNRG